MKKIFKIFISLIFIWSIIINTNVTAYAQTMAMKQEAIDTEDDESSVGLYFGPATIGNVEITITNSHEGYVPFYGESIYIQHINLHARNTKTRKDIINYHIVKYESDGHSCLYVYDGVSRKVIIDNFL